MFKPRSFTFICTESDNKQFKRKKMIYEFGNRCYDDFLAYYQKETVTNGKSSSKFAFNFQDPQLNITYVALTSNVRECFEFYLYFKESFVK